MAAGLCYGVTGVGIYLVYFYFVKMGAIMYITGGSEKVTVVQLCLLFPPSQTLYK